YERAAIPTTEITIALMSSGCKPNLRLSGGVMDPNTAKATTGTIPITSASVSLMGTSIRIVSSNGETAATAIRKLKAARQIPSKTTVRPRQSVAGWDEVITKRA